MSTTSDVPVGSVTAPEQELSRLRRRDAKLTALLDVAKALTRERDLDALLDLILVHSIETVDAERGSLFIMDRQKMELWSKFATGARDVIRVPVGVGIAGMVAKTGKPLNITDAYADARFNRDVDRATGFHTRSILCVPMLGSKQEVVGVVQALNHADGPFTSEDEELLLAFGANAAAAIENANLYEEIERLFEGFVQASVTAIESRDPSTAGHSGRVSALSITTLLSLERSSGPYKGLTFSDTELQEMRYAALLHDFGKVGVREHVLLKANKLYPHQLARLEDRFELARTTMEAEKLRAQVEAHRANDRTRAEEIAHEIELAFRRRQGELEAMLELIRRSNQPTVLEQGGFERLHDIAKTTFLDLAARARPLLEPDELNSLSIARGSLSEAERKEIESHVSHTYRFLKQIPWTRDLARVPDIAHGHHEKLNGRGYPQGLASESLPVQTRVMTIADIYDALTAADRPYKKAVPYEKALDILRDEAKRGLLDSHLLEVFIEADVARRALSP